MTHKKSRSVVLASACSLALGFFSGLFSATALSDALSDNANFNIPAQSIRSALIEFSKQADVQVMGSSDSIGDLRSTEVKGKLRASEALRVLLQSTGLKYEAVRHAVIIRSITSARADDAGGSGTRIPGGDPKAGLLHSTPQLDLRALEPFGRMLVTATHIQASDLIGGQKIVMDRQAIAKTGYSTVHEIIRSLPQNFGGGPSDDTFFGLEAQSNSARSSTLNLRGLGAGATLVLINGRRLAAGGTQSSFVDVGSIPLTAVARIEIVTDGASAVYGADAVGGVVNFIMRDDYEGAETQARFGAVTEGGLQETDISQLFGTRWSSGHVTMSYEFYHRDSLPMEARRLTANSDLTRFGGDDFSSRQSNPGTITIGNQTYAVPRNQNGTALTPNSFTPGTFNLQNTNKGVDLFSEQRLHSGFLSASQSVGDLLTLSGDALFSRRTAFASLSGTPLRVDIPASNPFRVLPAGASGAYRVNYNFDDDFGSRTIDAEVRTFSSGVAAKLSLPRHWDVTTSAGYSSERGSQAQANNVDTVALAAALADPNRLTAFNPFGDGSFTNPATLERIRRTTLYGTDSELWGANVIANGGLFDLPAGSMRLATGVDYRKQYFQTRSRGPISASMTSGPQYERKVTAAFAEVLAPIISGVNRVPGIEELTLSIAGRYDDFDDFGTRLSPRYVLNWSPVEGIQLHGSWGESFRAPNLPDMDENANLSYITALQDPTVAGGQAAVLFWLGGNSDLQAESATTWNVGLKWEPEGHSSGPTIDLSYFNIRFEDRVEAIQAVQSLLTDSARYASIVVRDPSAEQRATVCGRSAFIGNFGPSPTSDCLTGRLDAIVDLRSTNTSVSTTSGLDLAAAWEFETGWGQFNLTGNVSYLLDFSQAKTPTEPLTSLLDTVSNPLRFKMRDGVSWSRAGFGAAAFVNYAGAYDDNVSLPNRRIGSWTTLDLQLSYEVEPATTGWLSGCTVSFNVMNLFNTDPPFVNNSAGVGYDRENVDLLNRFIALRVQKDW